MFDKKKSRKGVGLPDTPEQKALREEAKELGLKFMGRPKAEKMRVLLEEHKARMNAPTPEAPERLPEAPQQSVQAEPVPMVQTDAEVAVEPAAEVSVQLMPGEKLYYTEEEYKEREAQENKRNCGRLVRCRITCMNPNKKNWTGEIVSVGSSRVGTFKKMIPLDSDEPYHIPKIIFDHLKERKCAIRHTRKTPDGREHVDVKMVNEFSLDVLPPLTVTELEDLRKRQAMAKGAS